MCTGSSPGTSPFEPPTLEERVARLEKVLTALVEDRISDLDDDRDYWHVKRLRSMLAILAGEKDEIED